MVTVYRRYLAIDPSVTERFTSLLLSPANSPPRPLEAAKLLLSLARKASQGEYVSPEGKSPYQLLGDWIDVVETFPDDVGLDVDDTDASDDTVATTEVGDTEANATTTPAPVSGKQNCLGAPVLPDSPASRSYDEDEDEESSSDIKVEGSSSS